MTFVESACDQNSLSSPALLEPFNLEAIEAHTKTLLKACLGADLYTGFFASMKLVRIANGCAHWSLPVPPTFIHLKYKSHVADCMESAEVRDVVFISRGAVIKTNVAPVEAPSSRNADMPPTLPFPFSVMDASLPDTPPDNDSLEALCDSTEEEPIPVQDEDLDQPRRLFIEAIQHIVANHYGLTRSQLCNRKRTRDLTKPRQVAIYLCSQLIRPHSLPKIGKHFGRRDHTTMLHSVRKIESLILTDEALANDVRLLTERIYLEHRMPLPEAS